MSFRATEWAYSVRELSGPEKAVLLCLAWHHNAKTGECFPGTSLIAEETCLGLSTVKKALASLIAKGLIERMERKGSRSAAWILAIVEPERPQESPRKALSETPHIEQENNRKERARARSDFSRWDWKSMRTQPAEPVPLPTAPALPEEEALPRAVRECVAMLREGRRERDLGHLFGASEIAQARKVIIAATSRTIGAGEGRRAWAD